jgi:homocitrate synthase NifV
MIRITDMTMSCLACFTPSEAQLRELYGLLTGLGTDAIEMTPEVYDAVRPPASDKIVLRLAMPDEASSYPEVKRFVCRLNGAPAPPGVLRELQLNDVKELASLWQNPSLRNLRIVGLDDVLCHDYRAAFLKILSEARGCIELCPEDGCFCATAVALEWITAGGTDVAAAFGGLRGKAALEEVLLALRIVRRHKPTASYAIMPRIAVLLEEITGARFPDRKAVIGRNIFNVESGIHVDGILKKPHMYEPFLPELVGRQRHFVIGKHSGRKSIAAKLREMGYQAATFDIARLLYEVRQESVVKLASLTDEEFREIALRYRL